MQADDELTTIELWIFLKVHADCWAEAASKPNFCRTDSEKEKTMQSRHKRFCEQM
jgi:hypothetical protein